MTQSVVHSDALAPHCLDGMRILMADDSADNRRLVDRFVRHVGGLVDLVENGRDAVTQAQAADYDLVLMDLQMPVMDGYEAVRQLRQAGFARPILALTASARNEDQGACIAVGFDGLLTKPFERTMLYAAILRLVQRAAPRARDAVG